MARSRNIKPGFFKNEDLAECSAWARLCFAGLWTLADREGRLADRPKRIKGELFAFDSIEVEPLLVELAERGFILRYTAGGVAVIAIPAFLKHQNPHHREQDSEFPPPPSLGLEPVCMTQKPGAFTSMDQKPEAFTPSHGGKAVLIPSSLIPDSPISDSMPTGANAPAAGLVTEGQFWQAGIDLLSKANMAEVQARTFLGKLIRDHGKPALHAAIGAAVSEQPVDPRAYLRAACARKPTQHRAGAARNFSDIDYREGIDANGHLLPD